MLTVIIVVIVVRIVLFVYLPLYVLRVAALAFGCMQHIFSYLFAIIVVVVVGSIYLFCCKYMLTVMHIATHVYYLYMCIYLYVFAFTFILSVLIYA